jgi:hypothetical protein
MTDVCNTSTNSTTVSIKIEQLNIVGSWDYPETKITNNTCNLCKRNIMAPSYDSISRGKCDTKISVGKCKHCFHTDCINNTLKANKSTLCPICITPWNFDKELDSNSYYFQAKTK